MTEFAPGFSVVHRFVRDIATTHTRARFQPKNRRWAVTIRQPEIETVKKFYYYGETESGLAIVTGEEPAVGQEETQTGQLLGKIIVDGVLEQTFRFGRHVVDLMRVGQVEYRGPGARFDTNPGQDVKRVFTDTEATILGLLLEEQRDELFGNDRSSD